MTAALKQIVQSDQNRLGDRQIVEDQAERLLTAFSRAVNDAAGKRLVECSWVHGSDYRYLSITNHADSKKVTVPAMMGWGTVDQTVTANYKITFGTVHNGLLSRFFGSAAPYAPGIAVNSGYVHVDSSGSKRVIDDGALTPVTGLDCAQHKGLNGVMVDIYRTLPETVRKKLDLGKALTAG